MIAYKKRESRRAKSKMAKNLEILYKEGKCRDCSVVVTRMNFAKILGKFTKVKIQYESNSSPKTPKSTKASTPVNTRLKSNENGMVLIRRNAYNPHPAEEVKNIKKTKSNVEIKKPKVSSSPKSNILKESNNCKDNFFSNKLITGNKSINQSINSSHKQYTIIFVNPKVNGNTDFKSKLTLADLISQINSNILPSEEWCIEFFPQSIQPKDDKMYNRIAAELEDLMYSKITPTENVENKGDEFPSIMDILNDSTPETNPETKDQTNTTEFKSNLESSDVEAMLLGKPDEEKGIKSSPMDVDTSDVNKLIEDVVQLVPNTEADKSLTNDNNNPHSPSILDETLQKGIEEHLPVPQLEKQDESMVNDDKAIEKDNESEEKASEDDNLHKAEIKPAPTLKSEEVTEVRFKKIVDGKCPKSVTCMKSLRYNIKFEEKSVEFLGAPKYISSIEDIQVLLQIVNESTLDSLYVLH